MTEKQQHKFYWGHDPDTGKIIYLTPEKFLKKLKPLITDPVRSMQEMDGDMLMSDYQKLITASWRVANAVSELDKLKGKDDHE